MNYTPINEYELRLNFLLDEPRSFVRMLIGGITLIGMLLLVLTTI